MKKMSLALGAMFGLSSLQAIATEPHDSDSTALTGGTASLSGRNISNGTLVLSISKTF